MVESPLENSVSIDRAPEMAKPQGLLSQRKSLALNLNLSREMRELRKPDVRLIWRNSRTSRLELR